MLQLNRWVLMPVVGLALVPSGDSLSTEQRWSCAAGLFRVGYASDLEPIEINRIHSWVIHIETATGDPVEGAEVTLEGGMPEHDHGLPTSPRVTADLGDGDYRVEGMRFHMGGDWEITVAIDSGADRDTCLIPLQL